MYNVHIIAYVQLCARMSGHVGHIRHTDGRRKECFRRTTWAKLQNGRRAPGKPEGDSESHLCQLAICPQQYHCCLYKHPPAILQTLPPPCLHPPPHRLYNYFANNGGQKAIICTIIIYKILNLMDFAYEFTGRHQCSAIRIGKENGTQTIAPETFPPHYGNK